MNSIEKMKAGLEYDLNDPVLDKEAAKSLILADRYSRLVLYKPKKAMKLLRKHFDIEENVTIMPPFRFDFRFNLTIGEGSFINYNATILNCAQITIGKNVFIGPNASLYAPIHPMDYKTRNAGVEFAHPITIKDNVWLAGNVIVLPGVTIEEGAVIGVGSVVTKDVKANSFYAGNPAKFIREIDNG